MKRLFFLVSLLMMVGGWGVSAQELSGVVYDEAGEPLPYATVKVKSIDGSIEV